MTTWYTYPRSLAYCSLAFLASKTCGSHARPPHTVMEAFLLTSPLPIVELNTKQEFTAVFTRSLCIFQKWRSTRRATEKLYHAREHAEFERLQAIADNTRKWKECEKRLVRRLEELEEGAKAGRATPTTGRAENGVGGDSLHQEATAHR